MIVAHGLEALPEGVAPACVTIGVFDGIHRGHQALMRTVVERARDHDARAVVVTFDRHPLEVVAPGKEPPLITTVRQRTEALEALGIDAVLVLRFDEALRRLTPEEFVRRVLVDGLGCVHVVTGSNFRFGFQHEGTIETLNDLGAKFGFGVTIFALVERGEVLSSSLIRRRISEGEVERAHEELGRPFRLEGVVERGAGRGRGLGIPTANLRTEARQVLPKIGVYAGWLRYDGERRPAVVNVGLNPTFEERPAPIVEAHALDTPDVDLYGRTVEVEFTHRLRDERRFETPAALVAQIARDIERARTLLGI